MSRLLSRIFGHKAGTQRLSSQKKRVFRLEALEDRRVPTTFFVTTVADVVDRTDGVLSLREAIKAANLHPGPDTIRLQGDTYQITKLGADNNNNSGDFDILLNSTATQTDSLTIVGADGGGSTILGDSRSGDAGRDRLFEVFGQGNVRFLNLTLRSAGNKQSVGGAVQAQAANIDMRDCTVTDMAGFTGGGHQRRERQRPADPHHAERKLRLQRRRGGPRDERGRHHQRLHAEGQQYRRGQRRRPLVGHRHRPGVQLHACRQLHQVRRRRHLRNARGGGAEQLQREQ
jgi:CSLREA domain-containing protein